MSNGGFTGRLYQLCEWITRLAYANILWLFFTAAGLIVFGLFPATQALFAVARKWVLKETEIPVFATFWRRYKEDFVQSNGLGYVLLFFATLLFVDLYYLRINPTTHLGLFYYPLLFLALFFLLAACYAFPIFVHYEIRLWQVLKNAFLITILHPLENVLAAVSLAAVFYLFSVVPGLIPFFCPVLPAVILTIYCQHMFKKVEKKQTAAKKDQ